VLDELELVMDSRAVEGQPAVKTELLPGRYLARALDAEGAAIASASFAVAGGEVHIALR
jgi:hypothetical protein